MYGPSSLVKWKGLCRQGLERETRREVRCMEGLQKVVKSGTLVHLCRGGKVAVRGESYVSRGLSLEQRGEQNEVEKLEFVEK